MKNYQSTAKMKRENDDGGNLPEDDNDQNGQSDQENGDSQDNSPESRAKRIKLDGNQEVRLLIPSKVRD